MKRTFVHKPTTITVYEFTGDTKEITDVLEAINDYVGYDKYEWEVITKHEPPFIQIYDDEFDARDLLNGGYMYADEDGNISLFSRDEMYEEWDLVEANENS